MKARLGSLFQTNAHSWPRRLYFGWLRRWRGVFAKRQSVHFVSVHGTRYKRVVFGDSAQAAEVESALDAFAGSGRFPPLVHRHENELLLGFVEGRAFDPGDTADRARLAEFLAALWQHSAVEQPCTALPFDARLAVDLDFLVQARVLDRARAEALADRAAAVAPATLVTGFDYVDPVAKNFVIAGEAPGGEQSPRLVAIDVESLRADQPLGTGLAQASLRWLSPGDVDVMASQVAESGGPDIDPQLDYVRLITTVAWTKRKFLQGKTHFIRAEHFDALLG
ncbi:hypothetical protein HFP89_02675 [Wenzhouxiangella sp. XN79A]|uniref:hypothetical protein n=1 Tax=Wenzhouxiangella sp. XN79A TaxID=2724193 RepID=UPI00144A5BDC|nr:hypothetical protein [Wenzhouxiangella sp. XN79A]NKI34069.1 hypothetical protein [Wenzhouxiangella sp. XN79A]